MKPISIAIFILFFSLGFSAATGAPEAAWPQALAAARKEIQANAAHRGKPLNHPAFRRLMDRYPLETDWLLQDGGPDLERWLAGKGATRFEWKLLEKTLGELGSAAAPLRVEMNRLAAATTPTRTWMDLYLRACRKRRTIRLAAAHLPARIVFTKHANLGGSHYAYTEGLSDAQGERHFNPGSSLCLLDLSNPENPSVKTLLADPGGVIRDPDVSFDGRHLLFSWKKSDFQDDYHLYEMDLTREDHPVRQLTAGLGFADYEGAYLPDGDIIFNSTRCVQIVDCWWTEVSNLYRCAPDGRAMRRLTFDQVHDNYPAVLPDGRVVYTRWEYSDRGQIYVQGLFQMNPDGTGQTEFYGNNSWFPTTILHARGIPGTQRLLAILAGHHTRQTGKLAVIDPALGRQEAAGVRLIAPPRPTLPERIDQYGQQGELFQYPYPLGDTSCLVAYAPLGWARPVFGIFHTTFDGRRELLAADPAVSCNQPLPLAPRPKPPIRPSTVDYAHSTATCVIADVYTGPAMAGVTPGSVKKIRVVALDYRAAGIGHNLNSGPAGKALISTPPAIGNGSWDVKVVLGETDVYPDGSAAFLIPARTPVYFQLLDAQGRAIQSMRSWTALQPGEHASCIGCHESKNSAPVTASRVKRALRAGPRPLRPFYGPPRGFSFPREIQPILDRRCIACHDGGTGPDKSFSLRGDPVPDALAQRVWYRSYLNLTRSTLKQVASHPACYIGEPETPMIHWIGAQSVPSPLPPRSVGAIRSGLFELLDKGHYKVTLTREEKDKLACWIDLAVPFCGDYAEASAWTPQETEKYDRFKLKRQKMEARERENISEMLRAGP